MIGIFAVDERVLQLLAVQVRVARIVGVHGDRGVAQHRLGARGRHHELGRAGRRVGVDHRVGELEQLALDVLFVLDLEIARAPSAHSTSQFTSRVAR